VLGIFLNIDLFAMWMDFSDVEFDVKFDLESENQTRGCKIHDMEKER